MEEGSSFAASLSELDQIVERIQVADLREQNQLYEHLDRNEGVVLFGAGGLGRQVARILQNENLNVLAFADNQRTLWDTQVQGVQVLSPEKAATRYADSAYFIVTLWHPCKKSDVLSAASQLRQLGAARIAPFSMLISRFPVLLPRMFWSDPRQILPHVEEIRTALQLFADDLSRKFFLNSLHLRCFHDYYAADSVVPGRQYFPPGLYHLQHDEVFVDCGAYDGDSLRDFLTESRGNFHKIIAFEPDPRNVEKLRRETSAYSGIDVHELAIASYDGVANFAAEGAASAAITSQGTTEVRCAKIDTALRGEKPTIIKMDIEGSEAHALAGGAATIRTHRPVLAVCVYHKPADLWELPTLMHSFQPESKLYLRSHCADGFDLVCYAIPPERVVPGS